MSLKLVKVICFVVVLHVRAAVVQKVDIHARFPLLSEGLVIGTHFTFVPLEHAAKQGVKDELNHKWKVENRVTFNLFCCEKATVPYVSSVFQNVWSKENQPPQLHCHFILPENLIIPIYRYDAVKKVAEYQISKQDIWLELITARRKWGVEVTKEALNELIPEKNS